MVGRDKPGKIGASLQDVIRRGLARNSVGLRSEEIAKITLAKVLADKRRAILRSSAAGGGASQSAALRRFAKDRARALKKSIVKNRRTLTLDRSILMRDRVPSPILDALDPGRITRWRRILGRRYKSNYPRLRFANLNFLDDPIATMNALAALSKVDSEEVNAYIDFDDEYCVDIGAYLVIAEVWPQLSPIFRGGIMNHGVQKVLSAVGLGRELNIKLVGVRDHKDIWPFEIRRRRPRGTTQSATAQLHPQGREQLNDHLVDLINNWLQVASKHVNADIEGAAEWELSGVGKANIANMVGEILDNAERHSTGDGDGDWAMAAFMAKRGENGARPTMKCYLAFLSVGRSIAETIETAPVAMRDYCNRYAQGHSRSGLSRETLLTIAALQDGVTSVREAALAQRGGTGLQDTIEFIGDLGGAPSRNADVRLTIVSGKSCIRLRHPTLLGKRDSKGRRVQWCNETNDPSLPPDEQMAFDLPAHFAGTLVSVAFTLDPGLFGAEDEGDGKDND